MSKVIKPEELNKLLSIWQPVEIEEQLLPPPGLPGPDLPCVEMTAALTGPAGALDGRQPEQLSPFVEWLPILLAENRAAVSEDRPAHCPEALTLSAGVLAWTPAEIEPLPTEVELFSKQGPPRDALLQSHPVVREAEERAAQIIQQAEAQAGGLLQEAENRAAELVRQAEEQAAETRRQAHEEGLAAAQAETLDMLKAAASIVDEVNVWREEELSKGELMMLRLVIEIAQSIFGEGLPLDPEVLGQAFSRALAQAKPLGDLRIYAHPEDVAILGPLWAGRQAALSGQQIELVPSDIIKRGGCFVEGQYGSLDARVESQLQQVQNTLLATAASHFRDAQPAGAEAGAA